jgi:hypothetical protein
VWALRFCFGFALRCVALWLVFATAPGFVSGWRAFSSVSLCVQSIYISGVAGRAPMRGLAQPSTEVFKACFAPRVWVWGFWFGFALTYMAFLYGVCVRLGLASFPAGGPFLPSLSVTL